jgi:hypothetical protein
MTQDIGFLEIPPLKLPGGGDDDDDISTEKPKN